MDGPSLMFLVLSVAVGVGKAAAAVIKFYVRRDAPQLARHWINDASFSFVLLFWPALIVLSPTVTPGSAVAWALSCAYVGTTATAAWWSIRADWRDFRRVHRAVRAATQ